MEMFSDASGLLSLLISVGYSLRYELTFGCMLLIGWCLGHFANLPASLHQKRGKRAPYPPPGKKQIDTAPARFNGKVLQFGLKEPTNKGKRDSSPPPPLLQLGRIEDIDRKLLRDPTWLVPQVVHMCKTEVQKAVLMYRAALDAGLELQDMPSKSLSQLFEALVTSTVRAGHMSDTIQLLDNLRVQGPGVDANLFGSVVKLCTSKHLFAECLAVYDSVVKDPTFALSDKSVWSCLLFSAVEARAYSRCSFFFDGLKASGSPSVKDYGNMVRLASLQGEWQLSLELVDAMQKAAMDVDSVIYNTALATCVGAGRVDEARGMLERMECSEGLADVITYNTIMKGYAKTGRMDQCLEVFESLKPKGIVPSQVTYGILLDGFINENQLDRAGEMFEKMSAEGGTLNTILFTTLIKGFARAGDVGQAMKIYEQMHKVHHVTPDLITFSILIKANCDADRLEEALQLLVAMTDLNLRPDEVVFNNLLAGCARQGNIQLGKRLYNDMTGSGIRPSNATFSILIRFYHQCKLLEDAVEMLKTETVKYKIDPEPRLFLQLIQSCIRERQGRRAVEVYNMMVERSAPTAATHSTMLATCIKLNMLDTAAEILDIAAKHGFRVDARDANTLLESATKKRKTQIAKEIAESMAKLGLRVSTQARQ